MDESRFWHRLEFRVCGELRQLHDADVRHLWCDGFEPTDVESDERGAWIVGHAWIMGGGDSRYSFRLRIGDPGASWLVRGVISARDGGSGAAAGSLWGSGVFRGWVSGRNALVAGWATGRLTG